MVLILILQAPMDHATCSFARQKGTRENPLSLPKKTHASNAWEAVIQHETMIPAHTGFHQQAQIKMSPLNEPGSLGLLTSIGRWPVCVLYIAQVIRYFLSPASCTRPRPPGDPQAGRIRTP